MAKWFCFLCVFSLVLSGARAEQAIFDAERPDAAEGLRLDDDPPCPARLHRVNEQPVISPPLNTSDYYTRKGLLLRVPDGFPSGRSEVYIRIEHLDTGLGLIQVFRRMAAGKVHAEPMAGYTCLGTGKPRPALFRLPDAGMINGAGLEICGVEAVRRIIVKTNLDEGELDAVKAEVPERVTPRVPLNDRRDMQFVISVAGDARAGPQQLPEVLDQMREFCPLAAALGFHAVESYVKWNFVEIEKGRYDWSFYDAVVEEAAKHNLKWFPLLIVGSAYTLPEWYHNSPENVGFVCLEHGKRNNIQTIFCDNQTPYVRAFLTEFGKHYLPGGNLMGIRLGPSGNFGESQYPAGGNWGYSGMLEHIHIGWWAGDPYAAPHFRAWLQNRYGTLQNLETAWREPRTDRPNVSCFIPQFAENARKRKDFVDWYMGAMTDWCERWAVWSREAMPGIPIYQSAGGWGFVESGTDFTDQTASMAKVGGGIRATNETDSYAQNFQVTRMMSSSARYYGVAFGSEPAGFNSAKGVASRIYNILVNNGQHLFFYYSNLLLSDQGIQTWLDLAPLLGSRADPVIEVAILYPDTQSKLDDGVFRNLYASSFYQRVAPLRQHLDFDYCSERMVLEGALSRYKVLILAWNQTVESAVLDAIDQWVRVGGTVIINYWDRAGLQTVEGDASVSQRWFNGDAGRGKAVVIREDREPPSRFADRVKQELLAMAGLDPATRLMLNIEKPREVYASVLRNGLIALLNYTDFEAHIRIPGTEPLDLEPYRIRLVPYMSAAGRD